jgi:hypothetical protein
VAKQLALQGLELGDCWVDHWGAQVELWRNDVVRPAWRALLHTMADRWSLELTINTDNQKGATTKEGGLTTSQSSESEPDEISMACVVFLGCHPTPSYKNKQTT